MWLFFENLRNNCLSTGKILNLTKEFFLYFVFLVDCLVCTDEDLRRNILTDFASINWLTVSFQISIY